MILHKSITTQTTYQTAADVDLTTPTGATLPKEIHLANTNATAANTVTVSFDGATDAMVLVPGARPWAKLTRCQSITKIWVKGVSSAVCDITIFD